MPGSSEAKGERREAAGKPSKFYAFEVIGGTEEKVALVIAQRAQAKNLDVRSIVIPADTKGLIIVEVGDLVDLYEAVSNVRNIKRRRPLPIKPEEVEKIVKPVVEVPELKEGDIVEVVAGAFKGRRGKVVEVSPSRGEAKILILDAEFGMFATVSLDEVRKVEEE
ncbi:transcription elongation factor Spt5 [Stetteria hydrogenophila]